jgi:uncharacterized membrane protein YfcA
MLFLGLLVTLAAGVSLGLFGGGGSLLILPTIVYFFHRPPLEATAYSLFVVSIAALVGTLLHGLRRPLPWRRLLSFLAPSMAAAYLTRLLIVPRLPESLAFGSVRIDRDELLMLAFSAFAAAAGAAMLRKREVSLNRTTPRPRVVPLVGAATGALTALLGTGGGFLVVPALTLLVGLPIYEAAPASLAVVTAQSIAASLGALSVMPAFDVGFVTLLIATMLLGVALGVATSKRVRPARLNQGYAWLVLLVAAAIAVYELR